MEFRDRARVGVLRESTVMLRKSVAIMALFLSFLATEASALGLGRVAVESSLNQPLRVRIEVLQLGDTRLNDVDIQLASPEDFQRFNIERASFLNNIRFSTEATDDGNFVVLTTSQIVREPYLSFILETRWANGRLLSEHTILLDLPVYQEQPVPQTAVRRPISAVVTPQSDVQAPTSPPSATAPATAAPSVQPILEPEVIAPAAEDNAVANEDADTSAPAIDNGDELEAEVATQEETAQPAPLAQGSDEQTSGDFEPAEQEADETETAESEPESLTDSSDEEGSVEADAEETPAEEIQAPEDEGVDDDVAAARDAEEVAEAALEPVSAEESGPETVTVGAADTLSDIALQVRPNDSVSIQQTMLALQELNPDAFTDGNINRLRRGEVLRVPSLNDIQAIGQREAVAEVSRQNQQNTATSPQPLAAPNQAPATEREASGQLSVVTADPDAQSTDGAGVSANSDNAELDQRIADLEDQLALREEEADRARIEKEELESRLAELDEQIAAAQEIIRLRDLQLAQLQQSLAEAAAEAEQAAQEQAQTPAVASAEPVPAVTPVPQDEGFVTGLLRTLMSNTMVLIGAVVAIILLLAGVLVMRNRSSQPDEERLDTIDEDEFKGVTESKEVDGKDLDSSDEGPRPGSEFHDYEESELDSELDDIISVGGSAVEEPVLDGDANIAEQIDILIEHEQLDKAELLANEAIAANPDDQALQIKRLEVTAAQGDLAAFELQAESLEATADPESLAKIGALREGLAAQARAAQPAESEVTEIEAQRQKDETASFLDDLGIDLDAFEDDAFELTDDEPAADDAKETKPELSFDELPEEAEPEEVDLMFDLASPEQTDGEESSEAETEKDAAAEFEIDSAMDSNTESTEESTEAAEPDELDSMASFDTAADVSAELSGGESKDPEDLEIDTLEFDLADSSEAELKDEPEEKPEEELDLETFSFDPPEIEPAEAEPAVSDSESSEDDDNVLDFDFDKSEISAESEPEKPAEVEAFDFDLEGDSVDTVIEKSPASDNEDEIELELGESSETDVESDNANSVADDFDFDLSELEIDADDEVAKDVEIELSDDDFLDLDDDVLGASKDLDTAEDDIEFDFEEEVKATETEPSDTVMDSADIDDDLDFLADEDVVFETPDFEGDPETLSDEDETATKLELAYAYQKMGDADGAREILQEVISEGTDSQVKEAKDLIAAIDSNPE